jgi:hypothetical protein
MLSHFSHLALRDATPCNVLQHRILNVAFSVNHTWPMTDGSAASPSHFWRAPKRIIFVDFMVRIIPMHHPVSPVFAIPPRQLPADD